MSAPKPCSQITSGQDSVVVLDSGTRARYSSVDPWWTSRRMALLTEQKNGQITVAHHPDNTVTKQLPVYPEACWRGNPCPPRYGGIHQCRPRSRKHFLAYAPTC